MSELKTKVLNLEKSLNTEKRFKEEFQTKMKQTQLKYDELEKECENLKNFKT